MKKCSICRKRKKLEAFYRRKDSPDGRRSTCKDCTNQPRTLAAAESAKKPTATKTAAKKAPAKPRTLRSVKPGEKPPPTEDEKPPKTVSQAAADGTTRELLVALRNRIATAVENQNTPARDLAALTKRLVEVVRDIEAIDARGSEDDGDEGPAEDEAFDESAV